MSRPKIELICHWCKKTFQKDKREHDRQIRNNGDSVNFFCSRSCTCKYRNTLFKNDPPPPQYGNEHGKKGEFTYYLKKCRDRKKFEYDVDEDYLSQLWKSQGGRCSYTGLEMFLRKSNTKNPPFNTASLDRIDSNKGYIKGNVQFVCVPFNLAKGNKPDDSFREFLLEAARSINTV